MNENIRKPLITGKGGFFVLIALTAVTFIVWQIPLVGRYILYPFVILGTWFHEMGHGLAAIVLGGSFEQLQIFSDGSGLATHSGSLFFGSFGRALVAAAGPLGPPLAGTLLISLSNRPNIHKYLLYAVAGLIIVSVLIWVRSFYGLLVLPVYAAALIYIGLKGQPVWQKVAVQFIGVQGFFSVYQSLGYLFSSGGVVDGSSIMSDTGVIADSLFLPHWIWAGLIIALSAYLFVVSLRGAYGKEPAAVPAKTGTDTFDI